MNQRCETVMTKNPTCCTPDDTAQRAAQMMRDHDVGLIPVCESDDHQELVGLITDRDLALKVVAEGHDPFATFVRDVMTREIYCCRPEDDLEAALEMMERRQVPRVPVVDGDGRILGIISQSDVANRLARPEK